MARSPPPCLLDPGWRPAHAGNGKRLLVRGPQGPCQSSGTLRTAEPVIVLERVPDEQQHRAEQRDSGGEHDDPDHRPAWDADDTGERKPQRARSREPLRAGGAPVGETDRAVEPGRHVGVVGGRHL